MKLNAGVIRDRETDSEYAVQDDCERAFSKALSDSGINYMSRFVPMGPINVDGPCNWIECNRHPEGM